MYIHFISTIHSFFIMSNGFKNNFYLINLNYLFFNYNFKNLYTSLHEHHFIVICELVKNLFLLEKINKYTYGLKH